ncbi:hypothetical protein DFH09DRAFT_1140480 [Mycena vulgaris]|nr:hypothetical protein DFH09DRAFT_1140480 [Mycena vulgaris]
MKRGFLNSGKAKAKLTKDTDRIAVRPAPKPELLERRHGVVENTGKPEGYETTRQKGMKELDPFAPTGNYDKDVLLYTTQPSIFMGDTPADFPDGWTECLLHADAKALILATPGFPSPLVRPSSTKYRLTSSPDKGLGLFSIGKICAGDLILSERPLTLVPTCTSTKIRFLRPFTADEKLQTQLYEWEQTLKVLFDRMHPEYQAAFMGLANSHQQDGSGPLGGIIRTNGLGVESLQTGRFSAEEQRTRRQGIYSAVCKEISRLNHSCSPNTVTYFDIPTFSYQLFAVRDIVKGEELTLAYTSPQSVTKERQSSLEPYGFQCTCAACREPFESDARRAMSSSISADNLEGGLLKLSLLEKEGIEATEEYSATLKSVMGLYIGLGDSDNARKYAGKLSKRRWSPQAFSAGLSSLTIQSNRPTK